MTKFQIITISAFVVFIIAGVIAFSRYKGSSSSTALPAITVWGTFPSSVIDDYVTKINNTLASPISVDYVELKPIQFSSEFVAALARGTGPDAILIPADMLLPHEDKLALVPYTAFPQRAFIDSYIAEAGIYLSQNGLLGVPFTVDPLVMYWNRDMFDSAGIATYPKYWDEFAALDQKLTVKDQNGNIRKSAVALGTFENVTNARELFGTLLLQSGNPITAAGPDGFPMSTVKVAAAANPVPALQFFARAVDPSSPSYSWNRGLPASKSAFLSGTLATYFGFASELTDLRAKNPNINFDVAALPQARTGGVRATYGKMYAFSLVRTSAKTNAAFQIISILTAPANLAGLAKTLYLPTVRRDAIAFGADDPYISIFNQSALIAKTWLDADPGISAGIFGTMVDSFTSGQKTAPQAIQDAGDQYDVVLRQAMQ